MEIIINTKDIKKQIKDAFDWVHPQRFRGALASSLNRGATAGRTQASKSIRSLYNVKAAAVKKSMHINKATKQKRWASVNVFGGMLPVMSFRPRQTKKGISVTIRKGKRTKIRSAFIQTVGNRTGVFARGNYAKSIFKFRKRRINRRGADLPINELRTISLPNTMSNPAIINPVTARMQEVFAKRLTNQLQRLTRSRR